MIWNKSTLAALLTAILLVGTSFPVFAESIRETPARVAKPWKEFVAERQQAYRDNPQAWAFRKTPLLQEFQPAPVVHSPNEADPVTGMITEWWCSSNGEGDLWDDMWMALIGETVKAGADAYVYLYSYLGDDNASTLETCADMLKEKEGLSQKEIKKHVFWIQDFETDAFWLRDFGPFFVADEDYQELSIEDALYYPGRQHDDDQPKDFAKRYEYPIRDLNLYYEGGNFLPNGGGLCVASSVVLGANPQYTEAEIKQLFNEHLGCRETVIVQALDDAATGHVDMWLAWANRTTLLVGQYTEKQDPVNSAIIEQNLAEYLSNLIDPDTGQPIEIIRVPMPSNCPPTHAHTGKGEPPVAPESCGNKAPQKRIWRTYQNVTLVNNTVILPVYLQDKTYEDEVIDIWENLGYTVKPVIADHIAPYQGEFHCITKTIPEL